jgi:hypothetical protein
MAKILEYARLLTMGAKSPIPKRKRKILKEAEKRINKLESQKTARTRAIERATGAKSDISKQQKEVARRARRSLMGK